MSPSPRPCDHTEKRIFQGKMQTHADNKLQMNVYLLVYTVTESGIHTG